MRNLIQKIPGARRLVQKLGLIDERKARNFLLARLPKSAVGAEIGVHLGDFSAQILERTSPRKLYLVDPWQHHSSEDYDEALFGGRVPEGQAEMDRRCESVKERFRQEIEAGTVEVCRNYSSEFLQRLPEDHLDWIYIDGNHSYEFVKEDLENARQAVKPGGLIMGDDYHENGWWGDGVIRAVDEAIESGDLELLGIRHSQFLLRWP